MKDPIPSDLPTSSRDAILYIVDRMAEGYTGPITLHLGQGGVRRVEHGVTFLADDLAEYRARRHLKEAS